MDATDAAILNPKEILQNLESLKHPYAEDAIDFILSLVDLADNMYVVLINEIGSTKVTKDYIKFVTDV
jgi:hypothetical protein